MPHANPSPQPPTRQPPSADRHQAPPGLEGATWLSCPTNPWHRCIIRSLTPSRNPSLGIGTRRYNPRSVTRRSLTSPKQRAGQLDGWVTGSTSIAIFGCLRPTPRFRGGLGTLKPKSTRTSRLADRRPVFAGAKEKFASYVRCSHVSVKIRSIASAAAANAQPRGHSEKTGGVASR